MKNNKDKQIIKNILREGIEMQTLTPPIVREELGEDSETAKYSRLQQMLSNDIINHSGIIRRMTGWGDADATERSLFRKKLNQEKNDQGGEYQFTKDEVEDIFSILMDVSKKLTTKTKSTK